MFQFYVQALFCQWAMANDELGEGNKYKSCLSPWGDRQLLLEGGVK